MSTHTPSRTPLRIIISGARGRMGARLCALAKEDQELILAGTMSRAGEHHGDAISADARGFAANAAHVVIDFSSDSGAHAAIDVAKRISAAVLIGTTALTPVTVERARAASHSIPVLIAPNTSLGVAALARLIEQAAATLGPGYHCSIVEAHHIHKKDAPSGTAIRLAEAARRGGASLPAEQIVAIRGGDVVGEHTVRFAGPGEYVEFTHRATSRDLFVRGALRAAKWLAVQKPGWWTMNDVLGLAQR